MNGSCVYGKVNTREGPSFDLDLPLSEKVMILGRCLGFENMDRYERLSYCQRFRDF